ncbi:hypothetical protein [Flavobacterium gelatinilyticum]|uniref:hypothetical protein n=1 Tax=Flavobacterium gelatinilyticum TaxID=3003260 RepID=UPI002480292B|nr:hypothetical protein [Flavobacterium gelatinilyticum]
MIKNLKNFRKDLYLLFSISISIIIFMESYLIDIPEIINGGYVIGLIILKICYSIMASIIFYFFAVHLKENKKRSHISPLLISHLEKLKSLKEVWLSELYFIASVSNREQINWPSETGIIKDYYPSISEIELLAKCTPLNSTRANEKNWIERTNRLKNEIQPICEEILKLDSNLKANEILLIGQLKVCDLFSKISLHKLNLDSGTIIANDNLLFIEPEIQNFLNLFEKIEKELTA